MTKKHYVSTGDTVRLQLPHSEVCMHMRVAGKVFNVRFEGTGAQIMNDDGSERSFAVTPGEAGFHYELGRYYCYPVAPDVADYKLWLNRADKTPHWVFYDRVLLRGSQDLVGINAMLCSYRVQGDWALTHDNDAVVRCSCGLGIEAVEEAIRKDARR